MALAIGGTGYEGSQACTISTEHVLTANPETLDAIVQLFLDVDALQAGDALEIRFKEKVTSAGTQREVECWTLVGEKGARAWVSPSFIVGHGWDFTLKQTAGTGRTIPWSVRRVT